MSCTDDAAVHTSVKPSTNIDGFAGVPVPAVDDGSGTTQRTWKGTFGELWIADALASCSESPNGVTTGATMTDDALAGVRRRMSETLDAYPAPKPASWMELRNQRSLNVNPLSNAKLATGLKPRLPARYVWRSIAPNAPASAETQAALDAIGVNLCVARALDEQTQHGALLLMPGADQRLIHATIRERAQLAMLHASDLLATLSLSASDANAVAPNAAALRAWAETPDAQTTLEAWAADFADAVRMHIASTQKLTELLARSASARESLPGMPDVPSGDDFASGSWRQRALAALFGGDPLTTGLPGKAVNAGAPTPAQSWPTASEWGAASPNVWTPGAVRALVLARRLDVVSLVLKPGVTAYREPTDIDVAASASWLYRDLEAGLRTEACASFDASTSSCRTLTALDITDPLPTTRAPTSPELAKFRLWQNHQLHPADIDALVAALVDAMPSTTSNRGLRIVGTTRLVELPGRGAKSLKLDAATSFTQHSTVELSSLFSGMGRHRVPRSLIAAEAGGVRMEPLYSGHDGVLEQGRRLGAVPALATVREALKATETSTAPGVATFAKYRNDIVAAIDAAIGRGVVAIRPVELERRSETGITVTQPRGESPGTHIWSVTLRPDGDDTFFTNGSFSLIAVKNEPAAARWISDPSSSQAGFGTLDEFVARGSTNLVEVALSRTEDRSSWSAQVGLPDGESVVLFARRRVGRRSTYRPLTGAVSPSVGGGDLPLGALFAAPGGSLGHRAERVTAVRTVDPSAPAFDGFDQSRDRLPDRTAEVANADAPLTAYADRWLQVAKESEGSARRKLENVLENLRRETALSADLTAAQDRQLAQLRTTLTELCGDAAAVSGSLDALEATTAAAACNVSTVTIDAYESTEAELRASCGSDYAGGAPASPTALDWGTTVACGASQEAGGTTEAAAKCMLDAVSSSISLKVPVAKPVACRRYVAGDFRPVGGILAKRMAEQRETLKAYREAVGELEAAGRVVVASARKADEGVKLAEAQIAAAKSRAENARRAGLNELASRTEKVAEALLRVNGANEYLEKLGISSTKEGLKAGMSIASSAASGASMGAAAGIPGVLVGAAAGTLVGVLNVCLGGPSDEEIAAAKAALDQAKKVYEHAQAEERRYAEFLGMCVTNAESTGSDRFGSCPAGDPHMFGSIIDVYARETSVAEQQKSVAVVDAFLALQQSRLMLLEKLAKVRSAGSELVLKAADLQLDVDRTQISLAQAKLEVIAAQARVNADYGFSQAITPDVMWMADGLVNSARRDALSARRALEFATETNLSSLASPLSNVGAPALWVDQVYDYDLSPLRVSGLSTGRPGPTSLDSSKLETYLVNLKWASTSVPEAQEVTYSPNNVSLAVIPGPAAKTAVRVDDPSGAFDLSVIDPIASRWQVKCPETSDCAPSGGNCSVAGAPSFESVCRSTAADGTVTNLAPESIKLSFLLDPWGQYRSTLPRGVLENLVNGRWSRLALNVRGSDIRDCSSGPPNCRDYRNSLYFTLTHEGPYYTFDPSFALQLLPLSTARVTGRARADGTSFDPSRDDLASSALAPFRRSELWGYPLAGNYELEIHAEPGQRLANIESVEILLSASYSQRTRR